MKRYSSGATRSAALAVALTAGLLASAAAPAAPNDNFAQVQATEINLLRALVDQGVIDKETAQGMLRRAGIDPDLLQNPNVVSPRLPQPAPLSPNAGARPAQPGTLLLPEAVKNEIIEQTQQEVRAQARAENRANAASLPLWMRRLSFGGDVRLRYLRNDFASDNSRADEVDKWYQLPVPTTLDSLDSHEHLQLRARLNAAAW
jgi:hypothetical protein